VAVLSLLTNSSSHPNLRSERRNNSRLSSASDREVEISRATKTEIWVVNISRKDPEAKHDEVRKLRHHGAGCVRAHESNPKDHCHTGQ